MNLLLISGCASTWATLSTGGLKALAAVQLFLSSIVCFIAIISLAHGIHKLLKRRKEKKAATSGLNTSTGKDCNEVQVHVETNPATGDTL